MINILLLLLLSPLCVIYPWFVYHDNIKNIRKYTIFSLSFILSFIPLVLQILMLKNQDYQNISFFVSKFSVFQISFCIFKESMIFGMLLSVLYPVSLIYSFGYFDYQKTLSKNYFMSLALSISIGYCIAYSANIFTSFVFYELLTFCTYSLVVFDKSKIALKTGRVYTFFLSIPALLFLLGIVLIQIKANSLDYLENGLFRNIAVAKHNIVLLFLLFLFGVSKVAFFPFHKWLPSAMSAPAPVSAILHAVLVVKSGAFILIMICDKIFGLDVLANILIRHGYNIGSLLASFSVLYSAILATTEGSLKKRLAYSTISQISYILLSIFTFSKFAITGAMLQFVAHAFAKISLFFVAGIYYLKFKVQHVRELRGLFFRNYLAGIVFILASCGIIGFPPTLNFYAKYIMIYGAFSVNDIIIMSCIVISTLCSFSYCVTMIYKLILSDEKIKHEWIPLSMLLPAIFCCGVALCGFIFAEYIVNFLRL